MDGKENQIEEFESILISTIRTIMSEITQHQDLGITGSQFHLLNKIEKEKVTNVKHLAKILNVKPSAITVMLERLVQHGFVSRVQDEKDRRFVAVTLTEEGVQVLQKARENSREILKKYAALLNEHELKILNSILQKFTDYQSK
ncbi:MarR family transcriptional regulator [Pradoshia sp. D12]|uniref:MarR family winged helix-turn-helix transcriptional regulator n=1 Tax=Bacillaceae TaxID=186817 RepID=UPI00112705A0|nr:MULTISPECIES: MarR family transcriptional regulator [Bacillaceae]QFK71535.1 MarR family transcriptional regulator [Pradoshia sp. D12]TPF73330.1 MarR family transcriptional regulator [Bacillus sp. D12]